MHIFYSIIRMCRCHAAFYRTYLEPVLECIYEKKELLSLLKFATGFSGQHRSIDAEVFGRQTILGVYNTVKRGTGDYGINHPYAAQYTDAQVEAAFRKIRSGMALQGDELEQYRPAVLHDLLVMDAEQDWAQQLHFDAKRNNNTRAFAQRGPDTGYDCVGEFPIGDDLVALLERLDFEGKLTRTIIYDLNPKNDDLLASIIGSFQDGSAAGKMQFGTAWWMNDHKAGMLKQMSAFASIGLLSRFVGMLTDSRSFLSYPRHEYFRRLLCRQLGGEMDAGEIPMDFELVGGIVKDICFNNAERYFKLDI